MNLTALLPYFGGKRTLAPAIVAELGPHRAYWEPFCGSMAVLLAKPTASMETVNDLYGDLTNLAMVIADPVFGPQLYRRLRRVPMSQAACDDANDAIEGWPDAGSLDLDRAYFFFIASWMGRNGVCGSKSAGRTFCVRYTANGGHAATRFASAVDSIPAWRRRLRQVTILNSDGLGLIERIDDADGTVIYCDPPYVVKGAKYHVDFDQADHPRLAAALSRFTKTRVVVSYYDHPVLAELYPPDRWTRCAFTMAKAMAHQGGRTGTDVRAHEVLLINGPSYAKPAASPLFEGVGA